MVSDSELIDRLREFLRNSDLNTTTTGIVRRQLEEDFAVDLSDKKQFIREQVDLFLEAEHQKDGADDLTMELEGEGSENGCNYDDNDDAEVESSYNDIGKEVKKRGGGFSKPCSLSPLLQEFVGASEMARTEVVKQLWNYIKEKNLQDPSNKRNIVCDEPLKALFGVNSINMFQMNKALTKHIWPLDSNDVIPAKSSQKEKQEKEMQQKEKPQKEKPQKERPQKEKPQKERPQKKKRQKQEKKEDSDDSERDEKRQKKGKSGFLAPLQLSDALVTFLGTGESALPRPEVVKRIWDYIKQNNLQDPSDKRRIICNEKLKELLDVDSFNGFTVSKLLVPHFVKRAE